MPPISKQVRLPFERLTEANLKPILKKFTKWGLDIASVDAPNKAKRESGSLLKEFTLNLEDGQKMLVRVKSDGTVFQVKLNSKVVPIKHVDDMDKAIGEMIDYALANSKAYQRAKIQREKRKKINLPAPSVTTSRAEKIQKAKEKWAELSETNEDLARQLEELQAKLAEKNADLANAQQDLSKEKEITVTLEKTLAELEGK